NVTATEDDGVRSLHQLTRIEHSKKSSLQVLYPPPRPARNMTRWKDDGVVPTISTSMRSAEEISFLTPNPPWRAWKRDSDKGRWGYRVNGRPQMDLGSMDLNISEKISLQDLSPPLGGRGIVPCRKGRWGWVNGDDHHGGRLDDICQLTHPLKPEKIL